MTKARATLRLQARSTRRARERGHGPDRSSLRRHSAGARRGPGSARWPGGACRSSRAGPPGSVRRAWTRWPRDGAEAGVSAPVPVAWGAGRSLLGCGRSSPCVVGCLAASQSLSTMCQQHSPRRPPNPRYDNQKCLQTLPNVPRIPNHSRLRTTDLRNSQTDK